MGEGHIKERGMRALDDWRIVELYLRRDSDAILRTSEKFGGRLRALAYNIVRDRGAAEECENDTYLGAWNSIPPHEPRSCLFAFLARITRHVSLNLCRARRSLKRQAFIVQLSREMEECIPDPDDVECRIDAMELKNAIDGFLDTLTEEKRDIFMRRYWYLDTVAAIAGRYSISESKVKTTLFRCREKLREYLVREGYEL